MDIGHHLPWQYVRRGDKIWKEMKDGGTPGSARCEGDANAVMAEMLRLLQNEDYGERGE